MIKKLIAAMCVLSLAGCLQTATGEKVGVIMKIVQNSTLGFCKTWEGEIVRGGYNVGAGATGASFDFTIEDPALVPKLQDAMDHGYQVKLHYEHEALTFCRSNAGGDFLTSFEIVNKPTNETSHGLQPPVPASSAALPAWDESRQQQILELLKTQNQLINLFVTGNK